jgi:hypothetical protein
MKLNNGLKNLKRNKMKQETIEEVAERLVKETTLYGSQEASIGSSARSYFETELRCVLLGMQYQQEQNKNKYSEEDMINFAFDTYNYISKLMGVSFNKISENKCNVNDNFIKYKRKHEK